VNGHARNDAAMNGPNTLKDAREASGDDMDVEREE
jgi:hypothetical protein